MKKIWKKRQNYLKKSDAWSDQHEIWWLTDGHACQKWWTNHWHWVHISREWMNVTATERFSPLSSVHTRGLVPATSRGDKFCHVKWPFLLSSKSSRRDPTLARATSPTNSNQFDFLRDTSLGLVPQNASCELFVGQVPATTESLRVNSSGDQSPRVCRPLG